MKKITKILLIIMMIFINIGLVKAEGLNIKLESITVKEKSSTITVEDPVISGDDVTSNITFNEKDDYVIFTLTFKNNENEKYKITSLEDNNETSNIDIEYDFSDEYIEAGETGTVDIKITYKELLINQESLSLDNLSITVNLEKGDSSTSTIVINPITGDSIIHYIGILVVSIVGIYLIVFKKKKVGSVLVIASILLIPITTFALIKFNFQFKFTGIKIIGQFEKYNVSIIVGDSSEPTIRNITYGQELGELPTAAIKEGHTFSKWVDSNNNEVTSSTIITGPISISPVYTKNSYNVTVNNSQNVSEGNVSGLYEYGSVITLTAIVREGFTFTNWSNGSTDNPLELVVGASDIEIEPIYTLNGPKTATFEKGSVVDYKMQELSGQRKIISMSSLTSNSKIKHFKKLQSIPDLTQMTDANIASTDDSEYPIYILWDENDETIYWWSDAEIVYLNHDSSQMFANLYEIESIDLSYIDTSNVLTMYMMFYDNKKLVDLDISSFNTSQVQNMVSMFRGCNSLEELDVSNFDTSNVTNMQDMFSGLNSLLELDVSNFDTSNVTNMYRMFSGMKSITELNLGSFDTSNVTDMTWMFDALINLQTIYVNEKFTTKNVSRIDSIFVSVSNLYGGKGTNCSGEHGIESAIIDEGYMKPGCFTDVKVLESYEILYNPNGGSVSIESKYVKKGESIGTLPTPIRIGYRFIGWYTLSEGGEEILSTTIPNSNIEYFAHWEEDNNANSINYSDVDSDGRVSVGDTVSIGTDEFWVIGITSDGKIKLLAKYNLDSNYRQTDGDYEEVRFSDTYYWEYRFASSSSSDDVSPDDLLPFYYIDSYGKGYVYKKIDGSDAPNYLNVFINNYKSHLVEDYGINGIDDVRLMSYEDVMNALPKNNYSRYYNIHSDIVYNWMSNQNYWLGSVDYDPYSIIANCIQMTSYSDKIGIRPMVVISSELINPLYIVEFDSQGGTDASPIIVLNNSQNNQIGKLPTIDNNDGVFDG